MNIDRSLLAPHFLRRALLAGVAACLAACSSTRAPTPADPMEGFNRAMFSVHEGVDKAVLKPVATGYENAVPLPARMSVHNVFDNLWEVSRGSNAVLQGKPQEGLNEFGRLLINSTLGIFGLFDVASEMGFDTGDEDLGQTLAVWGVPDGPYIFLPLIGPNTSRDLVGWGVEQYFYPVNHNVNDIPVRNSLIALRAVDTRAGLLPTDKVIDEAALDKYAYVRAAYLQHRAAQVHDGRVPRRDDADSANPSQE